MEKKDQAIKCSWTRILKITGIFLFLSMILLCVGIWMRDKKFVRTEALATGKFIAVPRPNKTFSIQYSCEIEYVISGKKYQVYEKYNTILQKGDKVVVYVNTNNPIQTFTYNPTSLNMFLILSVVFLIIFIVLSFLAWKNPTRFCSTEVVRRVFDFFTR